MKKVLLFIAITIGFLFNSNAQEQLKIDTTKSQIKWSCDYAFSFGGHFGIVNFKEGHFIKTLDQITSGSFTIDLNTIAAKDMDDERGNNGLTEHLKNEDFFDVKNHQTATINITRTKYHNKTQLKVFADLTIKGITKPITFQAEIDYEKAVMTTKFKIDRTQWGINYNSKGAIGNVGNSLISDAIGFEVELSL